MPSSKKGMKKKKEQTFAYSKCILVILIACLWVFCQSCGSSSGSNTPAANVILFVGDGMGVEHIQAAKYYLSSGETPLPFEEFPYSTTVATSNVDGEVTDSAASSTAMATGYKVSNSVVSRRIPGDGSDLTTLFEIAKERGKQTGLVTTDILTGATPAGFAAHADSRSDHAQIADQYLTVSKPDCLIGGATYITTSAATAAGYTVIDTPAGLSSFLLTPSVPVAALYTSGPMSYVYDNDPDEPSLSDMTMAGIGALSTTGNGFFLVVEGARIDHASHANDLERTIGEVAAFSDAVESALSWAANRDDTLILVTADHECGGLQVQSPSTEGNYPEVTWAATYHTDADVPLYSWGNGAWRIQSVVENTEIYRVISTAFGF